MNDNIKAGADINAGDGGYSVGTIEECEAFVKIRNKSLAEGRIREIAEQCNIGKLVDTWEYQKFAELIVKECIELNRQELAFNAFERMLNRYKEHFGVK